MLLAGILMPTTSFAQSNTLFNPDYNGDGFIGVDDILGDNYPSEATTTYGTDRLPM